MPFLARSRACPGQRTGQRARRRQRALWASFAALALGLLLALPADAGKVTERSKQKRAAESERAELRQKLATLKREISQTETERTHAADALAESEAAISRAQRALRNLGQEQRDVEARLVRLTGDQSRLTLAVAAQRTRLGTIMREHYLSGGEDRVKLLLSGDNPNRINRDLQYMGYLSQAQARLLDSLQTDLEAIEDNRAEAENARDELIEIAQEQQTHKAQLEQEKARRAALLAELSNKLVVQRKEAGVIVRDQQRLASLVDRLTKLIEEQRKAEAAARERRRKEQLARTREAEHEKAKVSTLKTVPRNPDKTDNKRNKVFGRNELTPDASVQDAASAFSALRGQLRLPVRGELTARYGSTRTDGPSWKGLFIRTAEGEDVKAVAPGQVVFAEWLRGFGNLLIIDHGGQYMTIYGNNQAVLKHAGDAVNTGDVIANAGNSGGSEHSGLYFEMRYQGRAFDPMTWISVGTVK